MVDASEAAEQRSALRKLSVRVVPLLVLVLLCGILDRLNISFAAVTMNQDLGLSNAQFGMAGACFAVGYLAFGIPSTLMLHRFGARRWITVMMIAWGVCSAGTAFVSTPGELMVVRFLLGVAEAGLTPGIILYISQWFPDSVRGRVFSATFFIQPISVVICGPLSIALLGWDGLLGFAGWQWLFVVEALPTLLLAFAVVRLLPDKPDDARWLSSGERQRILRWQEAERSRAESMPEKPSMRSVFTHRGVLALAVAYLGVGTGSIGLLLFLPLMIRSLGYSVSETGIIATVPGILGALMLPLWGVWSDRSQRRERVAAAAFVILALGLAVGAVLMPSPWALVAFTIGLIAYFGSVVPFWTLPSSFLTGSTAAAGIAFINISGNFGQFTGPLLMGTLADHAGSYAAGLLSLSASAAIAAVAVLLGRTPTVAAHRAVMHAP